MPTPANITTTYLHFLMLIHYYLKNKRSSRPEVFCKKGVLKNFTEFTGKHLCQSLKKSLWDRCFFCEFCEIFKNTYFYRTPLVAASGINATTTKTLWLVIIFQILKKPITFLSFCVSKINFSSLL